MSNTPTHHETHYRAAAIWCCLHRLGGEAVEVLARHPQADAIRRRAAAAKGKTLAGVLWDELPMVESAAGLRPDESKQADFRAALRPAEYFLRRRRAAQREEWHWLLAELPNLWRVLIELPPAKIEELAVLLGLEMMAQAVSGQAPAQIAPLFAALDEPLSRQVATRVKELAGKVLPRDVTGLWEVAYRRGMGKRTGTKLLRWLALSLLADLVDGLPARQRAAAARHCRSDLLNVLDMGARHALAPAPHVVSIDAMVLDVLGRVRTAGA